MIDAQTRAHIEQAITRMRHTQTELLDVMLREDRISNYKHAYHSGGIERAIELLERLSR